jgi:hypothetical protein
MTLSEMNISRPRKKRNGPELPFTVHHHRAAIAAARRARNIRRQQAQLLHPINALFQATPQLPDREDRPEWCQNVIDFLCSLCEISYSLLFVARDVFAVAFLLLAVHAILLYLQGLGRWR